MFAASDQHRLASRTRAEVEGGRLCVGISADEAMGGHFGLVVVGGDERGAAIALEVWNLRVDQKRGPLLLQGEERRHHRTGDASLEVVGHQQYVGVLAEPGDTLAEPRFGVAGDVTVLFVVDAGHLLVAPGNDAHLLDGRPCRVFDESRRRQSGRLELLA